MSTLTIRRLDDDVKQRLRLRAAREGVSMEEAARRILATSLRSSDARSIEQLLAPVGTVVPGNIADAIAAIVVPFGGVDFPVPPREPDEPFRFDHADEDDPS